MATTPEHSDRSEYDSEWAAEGSVLEVSDLAEGGTFATIGAADPEAAREAIEAAKEAEELLRDSTIVQRANWLETIAEEVAARRDELVDVIVREAGKPVSSAKSEVDSAVERFHRAVEEVHDLQGEYIEGTTAGHEGWEAIVRPEPVGTVLCVAPYNYPLATTVLQVAPALAAGNSIVLKPASNTPISAAILAECIAESGVPDGAFNYVPGNASEIGDVLAGHEGINAIALTGSSSAGKHVAKESQMVNLHMELGGNAPAIVFPDADLDETATACTKGSLKYGGQRCSAVSRVLAHESVHDDLVSRIDEEMDCWTGGDLFDEDTAFGPLISQDQAAWVETLVEDAVEKGATLVRGGERDGRWFDPTLLADVPHDARIVHEEQFGPVVAVTRFREEREAVAVANESDLALDAAVFTADHERAMRVAHAVDAGGVRINGAPSHGLGDIPFGGNESSGIGREGIGYSIEAYTTTKSIVLDS